MGQPCGAKQSLTELAWMNAQSVLQAKTQHPPKTVVVGVKGVLLYEAILIGDFVPEPAARDDGIRTRSSGIMDEKLFFPFFAPEAESVAPKGRPQ